MTVNELIERLQKIENKNVEVFASAAYFEHNYFRITSVSPFKVDSLMIEEMQNVEELPFEKGDKILIIC